MKKKQIYINKHVIKANKKEGKIPDPPISVRCGGEVKRGFAVIFNGPAQIIYRPEKPLACGAECWIETTAKVIIHDPFDETGESDLLID